MPLLYEDIFAKNIVNAEQARGFAKESSDLRAQNDKKFTEFDKKRELEEVNNSIIKLATLGAHYSWFCIKYFSTYETLIENGYLVKGGVVREALPEDQWATWGAEQHYSMISWEEV